MTPGVNSLRRMLDAVDEKMQHGVDNVRQMMRLVRLGSSFDKLMLMISGLLPKLDHPSRP
jgi:hypothetical protein